MRRMIMYFGHDRFDCEINILKQVMIYLFRNGMMNYMRSKKQCNLLLIDRWTPSFMSVTKVGQSKRPTCACCKKFESKSSVCI